MALTKVIGEGLGTINDDIVFGTAGKGVCLGVTSNTDSNTLDYYEEGTHTVAATCSTSGTITLKSSNRTMVYTKIGRQVTCSGFIDTNPLNSNGSGRLYIYGLPYTVLNSNYYGGVASINYTQNANNSGLTNGSGSLLIFAASCEGLVRCTESHSSPAAAPRSLMISCSC